MTRRRNPSHPSATLLRHGHDHRGRTGRTTAAR